MPRNFPRMVCWYSPRNLLKAGVEVIVSTLFGQHADQRTVQALTGPPKLFDYSTGSRTELTLQPPVLPFALNEADTEKADQQPDEFWFDYVADVGDGWDSTYSVAFQITRPRLSLRDPKTNELLDLKEGRILVFGGDQVYPTASRDEYERRFLDPYGTALSDGVSRGPIDVFAIPGNHDWYDSLRCFSRIFFTDGPFVPAPGVQTETPQTRSYFAIKLPHDWWLLGTDVQLGSDIDANQLEFFRKVVEQFGPKDRIILCTAEPHWLRAKKAEKRELSQAGSALDSLEQELLGDRVVVFIAGDVHHYMRYQWSKGAKTVHKITAGGGGAFLHPTHRSWDNEIVDSSPSASGAAPRQFVRVESATFPSRSRSFLVGLWNGLFAFINPRFGMLTGILYVVCAMMLLPALDRLDRSRTQQIRTFREDKRDQLVAEFLAHYEEFIRLASEDAPPADPSTSPISLPAPALPGQPWPTADPSVGGMVSMQPTNVLKNLKERYQIDVQTDPDAAVGLNPSSVDRLPLSARAASEFAELESITQKYESAGIAVQQIESHAGKEDFVQRMGKMFQDSHAAQTQQEPVIDETTSSQPPNPSPAESPVAAIDPPPSIPWELLWKVIVQESKFPNPFESMLAIVVFSAGIGAFVAFTDIPHVAGRLILGTTHGIVHWLAAYLLTVFAGAALALAPVATLCVIGGIGLLFIVLYVLSDDRPNSTPLSKCFVIVVTSSIFAASLFFAATQEGFRSPSIAITVFVAGWMIGSMIWGAYLFLTHTCTGQHWNEAFSSVQCKDWKCFVRFRISREGNLTIFPIGISKVCRSWTEQGAHVQPRKSGSIETRLIESPIEI